MTDNQHEMDLDAKKRNANFKKKVKREIGIEFFEKSHKNSRKFEHEIINLQTFRYD